MALQETDHKLTVAEAKARLIAIGEQAKAERAAKGPLGTMKGKAVVGGAAAALAIGLLIARPMFAGKDDEPRPRRRSRGSREWSPRFDRFKESFGHWGGETERAKNVKKAAVGGLSLGLMMQLAKPLLPHLAQFAAAKYAQYRMAKAQAAQAAAHEQVAKAQAAQATVERKRAEEEL
ncbi:MAG TPA: hypothetical protein VD997_08080 [Phycisphaerales bacterium]|nr:hypothetical protein [Phycisphaerales bacterium]